LSDDESVIKRLDVLIRLMLEQQVSEGKMTRKDQLIFMDSVGLTTGDMGKILGQSSKDISSYLKRAKTSKKSK